MRDGATLVDNMVIGKCLLAQYDIKDKTKGERVFWDKFWALTTWMPQALPSL